MKRKLPIELIFWLIALLGLAFTNPADAHFTLCPIKNLGFSFCPGCGLGHAISYLLHGDIKQSIEHHPLGIFALIVIIQRIFSLIKNISTSILTVKQLKP